MEATKKRKRDVEPPRITYDAGSRTFDRLFKEDNLEGMKQVVRKKLCVSDSVPVYLSQIRDGKSVDLEDDDDFSAFQSAAYSFSAAKVKVVLGDNRLPSRWDEAETPSAKRKRKKKRKSDAPFQPAETQDAVQSVVVEDASFGDNIPSSKKRKVSFFEPPRDSSQVENTEKSKKKKKTSSSAGSVDSSAEQEPAEELVLPTTILEPGDATEVISEKKKKKKKKEKTLDITSQGAQSSETPEPSSEAPTTKAKTAGRKAEPAVVENSPAAAVNIPSGDAPTTKKTKKRSRTETPANEGSAEPSSAKSITGEQSADKDRDDNVQRPSKKPKKKHLGNVDSSTATDDASLAKKKPASKAPSSVAHSRTAASLPPETSAAGIPDQPAKESKKTRKKKDKAPAAEPTETPHSDVPIIAEAEVRRPPTLESEEAPTLKTPSHQATKISQTETSTKKKSKIGSETSKDSEHHPQLAQPASQDKETEKTTSISAAGKTSKKQRRKSEVAETPGKPDVVQNKLQFKEDKPQGPTDKVDAREATKAAVMAVLSRKMAVPSTPTTTVPLVQATASSSSNDTQQGTSGKTNAPAAHEQSKLPTKCPICDESPLHARTRCSIVKSGIKAMRKRIAELEKDTSQYHAEVIAELHSIIEKRTKKPKAASAAKSTSKSAQAAEKEVAVSVTAPQAAAKATPAQSSSDAAPARQQLSSAQPPPSTQSPPSIQPLPPSQLSPSPRPPPSTQRSLQKEAQPAEGSAHKSMSKINENSIQSSFFGVGDVSLFTEKDLKTLMRGPRLSLKDVPSSDSNDDEDEEEELVLEEEDRMEMKLPGKLIRNPRRREYPTSSDEDDDEEDDESPLTGPLHLPTGEAEKEITLSIPDTQAADLSFQEMNALGSSHELDRTGNAAVDEALSVDLSSFNIPEPTPNRRKAIEVDSDTAVASQGEESSGKPASAISKPIGAVPVVEEHGPDPIEPSENPRASQSEAIASEDDALPMQSTPRADVIIRTRSQRNKAPVNANNDDPPTVEITQIQGGTNGAADTVKITRKTRSLTRISALPVPPNPSMRVIKPAVPGATVKTHQRAAHEETRVNEKAADETETTVKVTKTAVGKTSVKAAAKPIKTTAKTSAKPPLKAKTPATATAKITAAKGTGAGIAKTRSGKIIAADPEPIEQHRPIDANAPANPTNEATIDSWAVLQEIVASQVSTETPGMVDELLSSPNINPTPSRSPWSQKRSSQKTGVNGSSQDPLFVHSESQQSFPYSQYPDLLPKTTVGASPNDSEDEEEVEAAVVKPVTAKRPSLYRPLTEIASQQSFFAPRFQSAQFGTTNEPERDLYGRTGREEQSEESDTDSDSDVDGDRPLASHIPASRRAGLSVSNRK